MATTLTPAQQQASAATALSNALAKLQTATASYNKNATGAAAAMYLSSLNSAQNAYNTALGSYNTAFGTKTAPLTLTAKGSTTAALPVAPSATNTTSNPTPATTTPAATTTSTPAPAPTPAATTTPAPVAPTTPVQTGAASMAPFAEKAPVVPTGASGQALVTYNGQTFDPGATNLTPAQQAAYVAYAKTNPNIITGNQAAYQAAVAAQPAAPAPAPIVQLSAAALAQLAASQPSAQAQQLMAATPGMTLDQANAQVAQIAAQQAQQAQQAAAAKAAADAAAAQRQAQAAAAAQQQAAAQAAQQAAAQQAATAAKNATAIQTAQNAFINQVNSGTATQAQIDAYNQAITAAGGTPQQSLIDKANNQVQAVAQQAQVAQQNAAIQAQQQAAAQQQAQAAAAQQAQVAQQQAAQQAQQQAAAQQQALNTQYQTQIAQATSPQDLTNILAQAKQAGAVVDQAYVDRANTALQQQVAAQAAAQATAAQQADMAKQQAAQSAAIQANQPIAPTQTTDLTQMAGVSQYLNGLTPAQTATLQSYADRGMDAATIAQQAQAFAGQQASAAETAQNQAAVQAQQSAAAQAAAAQPVVPTTTDLTKMPNVSQYLNGLTPDQIATLQTYANRGYPSDTIALSAQAFAGHQAGIAESAQIQANAAAQQAAANDSGSFFGDLFDSVTGAISDVAHGIDQTVRNVVPGGWATVAAVTAAVMTGGASIGTEAAAEASSMAAAGSSAEEIASTLEASGIDATAAQTAAQTATTTVASGGATAETLAAAGVPQSAITAAETANTSGIGAALSETAPAIPAATEAAGAVAPEAIGATTAPVTTGAVTATPITEAAGAVAPEAAAPVGAVAPSVDISGMTQEQLNQALGTLPQPGPAIQVASTDASAGLNEAAQAASETPYRVDVSGVAGTTEAPSAVSGPLSPDASLATPAQIDSGTASYNAGANAWEVPSSQAAMGPVVPDIAAAAGSAPISAVTPVVADAAGLTGAQIAGGVAAAGLGAAALGGGGGGAAAAPVAPTQVAQTPTGTASQTVNPNGTTTTTTPASSTTNTVTTTNTSTGQVVSQETVPNTTAAGPVAATPAAPAPVAPTPLTPPTQEVIPPNTSAVAPATAQTPAPTDGLAPVVDSNPPVASDGTGTVGSGGSPIGFGTGLLAGLALPSLLAPAQPKGWGGYSPLNYTFNPKNLPPPGNPGLNPGYIQPDEFYHPTNAVQSQYYWGQHPYQAGSTFDSAAYNNVPNAPVTPWGIQAPRQPLNINEFIAQTIGNPQWENVTTQTPVAPK